MTKRATKLYLDPLTYERFRELAASRQLTVGECLRECLLEYLALRQELAAAMHTPGALGEPHSGLLHRVLATSEARMAASFTAQAHQIATIHADLAHLRAMLDRAVLSYLLHTPEVPLDQRTQADASGKRRYEQWQKAVQRVQHTIALAAVSPEEELDDDADSHRRKETTTR